MIVLFYPSWEAGTVIIPWGNNGVERLDNILNVKKAVNEATGTHTHIFWLQSLSY